MCVLFELGTVSARLVLFELGTVSENAVWLQVKTSKKTPARNTIWQCPSLRLSKIVPNKENRQEVVL